MSSTSILRHPAFALRSEQMTTPNQRVEMSHRGDVFRLTSGIRTALLLWNAAVIQASDTRETQRLSHCIVQSIANVMRGNAWTEHVEQAVRTMIGNNATFYVETAKSFARTNGEISVVNLSALGRSGDDEWPEGDSE